MEKQKLSGKTILKLVGALLALAYLGFYFYVGITGKLPYMHETVHIMRYGDRKKWVAGGMTAAMILGICINSALNDLNLKRIRKESFLPLFFTMIFPIILLLLLEAFLDNGWLGIGIYASVAIFMCATAWIPLILRKWITHLLLRDKPMSGKQQVRIIEWIHFHPLKKLLVFGLWGLWRCTGSAWHLGNGNRENRNGWRAFSVFTWHSSSGCSAVSENEALYLRALPEHTGTESDSQQKSAGTAAGWRTF